MQSLSLQKALPASPEAKPMPVPLNALKAKPMPAEGKPVASCDESPRNIPFHPVSAFHRFSVSPFQTPISLKRNETTEAKQIPASETSKARLLRSVTLGFAFTQKSTLLYIRANYRTHLSTPLATHPRTDRFVSFHPYIYLKRNETTEAKQIPA